MKHGVKSLQKDGYVQEQWTVEGRAVRGGVPQFGDVRDGRVLEGVSPSVSWCTHPPAPLFLISAVLQLG